MSEQLLTVGAEQLGVLLEKDKATALLRYFTELKKWSRKINLIARDTDDQRIIENHFLDSLTLAPMISGTGSGSRRLLDVGTGAGFPGLVLAVVLPEVDFTLVEPRKKRVSFLQHIVRTLGLTNVEIVADRVEIIDERQRGFSWVTGRAVASPGEFLPMVHRFLLHGAKAIVMVAKKDRLAEVETLGLDLYLEEVVEYSLPLSKAPRFLGVVSSKL